MLRPPIFKKLAIEIFYCAELGYYFFEIFLLLSSCDSKYNILHLIFGINLLFYIDI